MGARFLRRAPRGWISRLIEQVTLTQLNKLATDLFRKFPRFEYALKAAGFVKPQRDAMTDWTHLRMCERHLTNSVCKQLYTDSSPPRRRGSIT